MLPSVEFVAQEYPAHWIQIVNFIFIFFLMEKRQCFTQDPANVVQIPRY